MYQVAYVLSSKVYYSENFIMSTHYCCKIKWIKSEKEIGAYSPEVGWQSIIYVTVPVPKDIKYRSTKITETLFTIKEISKR